MTSRGAGWFLAAWIADAAASVCAGFASEATIDLVVAAAFGMAKAQIWRSVSARCTGLAVACRAKVSA